MTVYNMPIWLRNHEYMKIVEYHTKPQQELEKKKWEEAKQASKSVKHLYNPGTTYNVKAPTKK